MSEEIKVRRKPRIGTIVCIVLIVLLFPILACNMTMVIKGMVDKKNPPSVFGVIPLAVLSGSMDDGSPDCIKVGDMIFVKEADVNELKVGDIITFSIGDDYITHRIKEIKTEDGAVTGFVTKGDANNTTDGIIPIENVYGKYYKRIPNLGNFAIFLQTPVGIIVFVGIPFAAYIIIDIMQRLAEKRKASQAKAAAEADDKDKEIEHLRALLAAEQNDSANNGIDGEENNVEGEETEASGSDTVSDAPSENER